MERKAVESSNIASIGYENGTLEVEFKNGGIFQYLDVPAEDYGKLIASKSAGKFLHGNIKPNFACRKAGDQQ